MPDLYLLDVSSLGICHPSTFGLYHPSPIDYTLYVNLRLFYHRTHLLSGLRSPRGSRPLLPTSILDRLLHLLRLLLHTTHT